MVAASSAFPVNFLLGLRFLFQPGALKSFRRLVGWLYVTAMVMNWLWQAWWMYNIQAWDLAHVIYVKAMGIVIYDDIVLIKWLLN